MARNPTDLVEKRHALFAFRKVFTRVMPYGTHLGIDDTPASVSVIYKGKTVLHITETEMTTELSPVATEEVLTSLFALLPKTETVHG